MIDEAKQGRARAFEAPMSDAVYPFSAIVGLQAAKRALLLLAVEPRLKGALIAGGPGSAKTTLMRGFAQLYRAVEGPGTPIIELPLNVTEDRLLGGIDIERTLQSGTPKSTRGLLAQANGGLIHAEEINLLEGRAVKLLSAALDSGSVMLEREAISEKHEARFVLVGSCDPAEGETDVALCDRVGLRFDEASHVIAEEAAEITVRALEFRDNTRRFLDRHESETAALALRVAQARKALPRVRSSSATLRRIAQVALALGVEGNRADVLAVHAARANAALENRECVDDQDLIAAIRFVLVPRATRLPDQGDRATPRQAQGRPEEPGSDADANQSVISEGAAGGDAFDLVFQALDASFEAADRELRSQRKHRAEGRRRAPSDSSRGRHYRSSARKTAGAPIAIAATIRAAACNARRAEAGSNASHVKLLVAAEDLRYKRLSRRSGSLFILVVDASGSMAVNRMAYAKGAMIRLLERAYLNRDKVAMISFRQASARVLLAPTRSVELARRVVDAIPTGGATPLAAGILKAIEVERASKSQGMGGAELLIFTDGRANVGLGRDTLDAELSKLGEVLRLEGLRTTVVDTQSSFISAGRAKHLAELLGAEYGSLSPRESQSVSEAFTALSRPRRF